MYEDTLLLRFLPLPAPWAWASAAHAPARYPLLLSSTTRCRHRDATRPYLCHPRRCHRRRPHSSHPSFDLNRRDTGPVQDGRSGGAAQPAHTPPLAASLFRHSIDTPRDSKVRTQSAAHFGLTLSVGDQGLLSSRRALLFCLTPPFRCPALISTPPFLSPAPSHWPAP
ncbi:hypothetical protein B0H65DRAFT_69046 [Neurospora tetraspora]|uniref:Uncharacterized protein n=1 Tax=Neurospora tetraspora TaxID=94610 RepID=A0AAE0JQU8_9PEZI|nr:hypothetical protein B0H65DRAFT_69046 [Neurospora tetraspora]